LSKAPFIFIIIALLITGVNIFFQESTVGSIIATGILFVAAGLILLERKKNNGHKTIKELVKNEFDIIVLMLGVIMFAMKFLVEEPLKTSLHLFSLSTIFISMGFKRNKRNKNNREF
jgi:membrane-bound ClpP family serine protease